MTALARVFVDTNVLIYARDRGDPEKQKSAASWLSTLGERSAGRLNLQVLNEFTRWTLAKDPARLLDDLRQEIDILSSWGDKPIDRAETELAWVIRAATGYQWFDCLLLAAAEGANCSHFLTEDMMAGRTIGSLEIVNPFRTSPSDILRQN